MTVEEHAKRFYAKVREDIERFGRSLVGCFADEGESDPTNSA